ncbi:hypothetical protein BS78_10G223800 [Paspalum vaginatum]|nr:hypothetical protein BS78_10G223800 [Paspalum vaginatum]
MPEGSGRPVEEHWSSVAVARSSAGGGKKQRLQRAHPPSTQLGRRGAVRQCRHGDGPHACPCGQCLGRWSFSGWFSVSPSSMLSALSLLCCCVDCRRLKH